MSPLPQSARAAARATRAAENQNTVDLMGGEDSYRQFVRLLNMALVIVVSPLLALNILLGYGDFFRLITFGAFVVIGLTSAYIARTNPRLAMKVLVIATWLATSLGSLHMSGIYSPILISYPFIIAMAAWLINRRWLLGMTLATLGMLLALGLSAHMGWHVPEVRSPPLLPMATTIVIIGISAFLAHLALSRAIATKQQLSLISDEMLEHSLSVALREHETRMIMDSVPVMLLVLSCPDWIIRDCNQRYAHAFGLDAAELRGRTIDELFDNQPQLSAKQLAMAQRGESFSFTTDRIPGPDGATQWTEIQVQPELRDGALAMLYISGIDISERVRAQAQIQALNRKLEAKVERSTRELSESREALGTLREELTASEARATVSALVASVSHELGTPLGNSVIAASTLADQTRNFANDIASGQLRRSALDAYVQSARTGTDLLLRNLERARTLMNNFRQVAADQASEQRRSFDLAETVGEVLDTIAPSLKNKPQKILTDIPPGIVLDSYPGPLGQVVINLVNNAFLHAFEGLAAGTLRISAEPQGGNVLIALSDDGTGMTPDTLTRLFQPFFSTKIGKGGTGLGMAIVDGIVRKTLGGTLHVESTPGQGTRFNITLPLTAPA